MDINDINIAANQNKIIVGSLTIENRYVIRLTTKQINLCINELLFILIITYFNYNVVIRWGFCSNSHDGMHLFDLLFFGLLGHWIPIRRIKLKAGCGVESNLVLWEIECGKEKVKMIHILKRRKNRGIDIFRIHF